MCTVPLSDAWRKPIHEAIVIQVILGLLGIITLDGGILRCFCGITFTAFWITVALMMIRRAQAPTRTDLAWVRLGSLLVLGLGIGVGIVLGVLGML